MNHTTERFHRTLASAFPQDHAEWITKHTRPLIPQWLKDIITAILLGVAGAELLILWLMS